jgi:glycosyltransferase involved in cell wall biosynthesis
MYKGYEKMLSILITEGWTPDLIQAQCTDPAGFVASRLSARFHIPWFVIEHQAFALSNYSPFRAKLIKQAISSAPFVAVTSQHQVRCLAVQGLYPNVATAINLIDEEVFKLSPNPQKNERFRILTLMWYGKLKDPETFFHAIGRMIELGHEDFDVIVIGRSLINGKGLSDFEQLAQKYKVLHLCKFLTSVTDEELVQQHAQSDVFVSTSVAETFGIAVREAMALGKPVVCTASGGVDDDINSITGIKVDIYDFENIARALIGIKNGSIRCDPKEIRNYVVSKYGRRAFLESMRKLFDDTSKLTVLEK